MRSPRLFSFLGNQSNRLSQGRAKQTCSSTGSASTIIAVELQKPEAEFPRRTLLGSSLIKLVLCRRIGRLHKPLHRTDAHITQGQEEIFQTCGRREGEYPCELSSGERDSLTRSSSSRVFQTRRCAHGEGSLSY